MRPSSPILTQHEHFLLEKAKERHIPQTRLSLDIHQSQTWVSLTAEHWEWKGKTFPFLSRCRPNTFYYWDENENEFSEIAQYHESYGLIKLIPTEHGPPTFQIDGIQMLPSKHVCPFEDASQKVMRVKPQGKIILDTCGGLGYFAKQALEQGAKQVDSFEINSSVIWLREKNPWSPDPETPGFTLKNQSFLEAMPELPSSHYQAILHDPPRFSIAGELYSTEVYQEFFRVAKPGGLFFHYTGTPYKASHGRDFIREVKVRVEEAGFRVKEILNDGLLAEKSASN